MINLDSSKVKVTTITLGGNSVSTTVDTVWVDYMELSRNGSVRMVVRFGTKDAEGNLVETDTPITATINSDGTFTSNDPKYAGTLDAALLKEGVAAALKSFEQAMIAQGLILGTVV